MDKSCDHKLSIYTSYTSDAITTYWRDPKPRENLETLQKQVVALQGDLKHIEDTLKYLSITDKNKSEDISYHQNEDRRREVASAIANLICPAVLQSSFFMFFNFFIQICEFAQFH